MAASGNTRRNKTFEDGAREMSNLQRRAEWMSEVCRQALLGADRSMRRPESQAVEWNAEKGNGGLLGNGRQGELACLTSVQTMRSDWEGEMDENRLLDVFNRGRSTGGNGMHRRRGEDVKEDTTILNLPNSAFINPFQEEGAEDEFHVSVGLSWMVQGGKVVVTDIEPGSPAFFSQLEVGDQILYVNDSKASSESMGTLNRTLHDPYFLSGAERLSEWVVELQTPVQLVAQRNSQLISASLPLAPVDLIWTLRSTCTSLWRLRQIDEDVSSLEERHLDAAMAAMSDTLRNLVVIRLKEWLLRGKLVNRLVNSFAKSVEKKANSMTALLKASNLAEDQRSSQLKRKERAVAIYEHIAARKGRHLLKSVWSSLRKNVAAKRRLQILTDRVETRVLRRSYITWRISSQRNKLSRDCRLAEEKLASYKYKLKLLLFSFSWWNQVHKTKSLRVSILRSLSCKSSMQDLSTALSTWRQQVERIHRFRWIKFSGLAKFSLRAWKRFVKVCKASGRSTLQMVSQTVLRLLDEINDVRSCILRLAVDDRKQHQYIECLEKSIHEAHHQLSVSQDLQAKAGEEIRKLEGQLLRERLNKGSFHHADDR
eukprot:751413-Hanusia_phi.AAC.1